MKIYTKENSILFEEKENTNRTIESDITNVTKDENSRNNKMICSSSSISIFFPFLSYFNAAEVDNGDYKYVTKFCECYNKSNIYLKKVYWCYNRFGQHNLIELNLKCVICDKKFISIFHKTSDGKKNILSDEHCTGKYWIRWEKEPKNYISYLELLKFYDEESNDYNLFINNCYHFARAIWNKIE